MMTPDEQLEESCQVPWTSCEEYGCDFYADEENPTLMVCRDCGAWYRVECA
jgi:hypothetical protein